ncbi:polyprenyl synthetase family protein [Lysinibacillus pakistanensis]|uniref:Polyprenyl synthetase n=1 Tax=Lysinibacillus pakistanensis TaxID=759811 RepID=A0ABX6DE13_9BACI|nr:polyprenyl synthetase [Lysinibacillus pakistanensis]
MRTTIQLIIKDILLTSGLEYDIQKLTLQLLHQSGKIFSQNKKDFTWGEFSYYVFSLLTETEVSHTTKMKQAAGIELLMLATDLFDDIIDHDNCLDTPIAKPQSLMIGNLLLVEALHLLMPNTASFKTDRFAIIHHYLRTAGNGQWLDFHLTMEHPAATEEQYFHIVQQKSCSFLQLIFELHSSTVPSPILQEIAIYIGYGAQLQNDIRDIFANHKSDLLHQKATLPLIKAVQHSNTYDHGWLLKQLQLIRSQDVATKHLTTIREYIYQTGAIDYCSILAKYYTKKAKSLLQHYFNDKSPYIKQIIHLID